MEKRRTNFGRRIFWIAFVSFSAALLADVVNAQGLLNDTIDFSGLELDITPVVRLPEDPILSTSSPAHDPRLYVSSSIGRIHVIDQMVGEDRALAGKGESTIWFDAAAAIQEATGREINFENRGHGGMRSFAFHPEFANAESPGHGKFYISAMLDRPADPSAHHYLGESVNSGVTADSVVLEFTYNFEANQVPADTYRELFRINVPVFDHTLKQIKFNQHAVAGDEDYGLLYITHGDAATQASDTGGGQLPNNALGKVLRVDPLERDGNPYTTPNSPFASDPSTLNEIYALGFRNPHNLSFAKDNEGNSKLIVADIGRNTMEEVNIVEAGADYGWSTREGNFVHLNDGSGFGLGESAELLPDNEAENGLTYPAAMYDHRDEFQSLAIAGAHVVANGSELDGQYVFGDFGSTGYLYHASFDEMLDAVTKLDPNDPDRDEPSELTYVTPERFRINFEEDEGSLAPIEEFDTFTELLDRGRSDLRFGEGSLGEVYITSKQNGTIYLVTNSLPLLGDADFDGQVQFSDFLRLSQNFSLPGGWAEGDFDRSGVVEFADFLILSRAFGNEVAAAQVPEPRGFGLLLVTLLLGVSRLRRSR